LTAALAIVYGPLTDDTPSASLSKPITGGAGAPNQHSAPVMHERLFIVVDRQATKATPPQDDGKSKAALLPAGVTVPVTVLAVLSDGLVVQPGLRPSVQAYGARAPPASS
jgi:hypothetical protein